MKLLANLLAFTFPILLFGQQSPGTLEITPLTGDFYVFTTYKIYGKNPFPSNGLYLVTKEGVVLIDTPWDTGQLQPLLDSIQQRHGKEVVMCLATHSHEDRTGGLGYYRSRGIRTFTSEKTDKISREKGEERAEFLFKNDTTFTIGDYSLQAIFPGEGHTSDNLVVWFDDDKVLYGGCLIKSTEATDMGNITEANLTEWPLTIQKLKDNYSPKFIIPGHQGWDNTGSLDHTIMLLEAVDR